MKLFHRPSSCLHLVALLLVSFCLLPLQVRAEGVDEPTVDPRTIVVGGDRDYPPYEFVDKDGRPAGYNVDLTRAIADVMGMKVEFRFGSWSEMRSGLNDGSINILQGISYSEERARKLDFSPPHTIVHHAVFARRGTPAVNSLEELRGKKVIVFRDGIMHDLLVRLGFGNDLILTGTPADALRLLASGKYDYCVVASLPGMYLIRELKLGNLVQVAKSISSQKYCFAVKKGDAELLARFSEGLAIVMQTGQYQAIYDKWLGVHEPPRFARERVLKYGAMVLIPLVLGLMASVVWSRTLQRRVASRTEELAKEVAERKLALEELRRHQDKLIQADKMASLGILVSGVAHEINNPNGLMLLNLPILRDVYADALAPLEERYRQEGDFLLGGVSYGRMREEVPRMLEEMVHASQRIKRIVEDLKDFARPDAIAAMEPFDLNRVVQAAVRLVDPSLRKATNRFSATYGDGLPAIYGNPQRIEQVVVNLLINACQSLPASDRAIALATAHDPTGGCVTLTIRDEGVGIPAEHLPRLTDPFFTTKRESGGTGLGLSISAGIVQEHGGEISFTSPPDGGTSVSLSLPAMKEEAQP
ncbi:transporter substrate-binding domain-containing protein [Geobacter argillaceus]|uniref:histidine kinase n=1 Tax=Geobacter argillaceus TaxID=345631 RepID=A0A562VKC3_9BACT|nr:transporter substrate-binding domain-containing protein [Geobacter argillaceus]TWJ18305.1 amino acid-binding domain sensor histidine kinase [Geobacter argillaceus]